MPRTNSNALMSSPGIGTAPVAAVMPRRRALQWLGTCGALCSGAAACWPAWGTTAAATAAPPATHAWLAQSRRVGHSTLRMLGLNLYEATLYALADFDAAAFATHALVLELRYRRSFAGEAVAERSLKEMRRGGTIDEARAERWLQFMRGAFPDVKAGDRLTGQWQPARAVSRFAINDASPSEINDAEFGPRFFGIWLATHTSQPELREQLLGLKGPG